MQNQAQNPNRNTQQEEHVISATDISHALKGVNFPASLDELINQASNNNAPQEVVNIIRNMPNQNFNSMADVEHAFSREKRQNR